MEKSFEGETTLAPMFTFRVATNTATSASSATTGWWKRPSSTMGDHIGSPKIFSEAEVTGDADERIERHRNRQAEGLADDLRVLRLGIAGEVGDVQRERCPVANHRRQRRKEEMEKAAGRMERLGADSMGPRPPALCSIQKSRVSDITSMKGAE